MSFWELMIIILIAIIVIKPRHLPKILHYFTAALHTLKKFHAAVTEKIHQEITLKENEKRARQADAEYHKTSAGSSKPEKDVK